MHRQSFSREKRFPIGSRQSGEPHARQRRLNTTHKTFRLVIQTLQDKSMILRLVSLCRLAMVYRQVQSADPINC